MAVGQVRATTAQVTRSNAVSNVPQRPRPEQALGRTSQCERGQAMSETAQMINFTGIPGTGKSTRAEEAAALLNCPLFAKDRLEAALWRSGIGNEANSGWAAYELLTTLASEQLRRGQSAILDSVATIEPIRARWHAARDRGVHLLRRSAPSGAIEHPTARDRRLARVDLG